MYNDDVWIYFTQFVLAKLCMNMLYNQVNCNIVISSSRNDDVCIFFRGKYELFETRLHESGILQITAN